MNSVEALFTSSFFDWYQVTFTEKMDVEYFVKLAGDNWDFLDIENHPPRVKQYTHGLNLKRGDRVVMHLCWGGHNIGLHVVSTGGISHDVATWMQSKFPGQYAVSRADVRLDTTTPGMFDYMIKQASEFALERKIKTNHQGDWLTGVAGRTLYLGSKDSVVQVRIYEKGKKEGGNPDWVRLEIQVRPSKAASKEVAANFEPFQWWQSSKWSWDFMNKVFCHEAQRSVQTLGTVWRASDRERAVLALVAQYGNILEEVASSLPSGWDDIGGFLKHFRDISKENKKAIGGAGESPYEGVLSRMLG